MSYPSSILADLELAIDDEIGEGPIDDDKLTLVIRKTYQGIPDAALPNLISQIRAVIATGDTLHADWKGRLWADDL